MNSTTNKKKKVIDDLLKKKMVSLTTVYGGGIACSVRPKPILTQCYICTVTPPKDPNGPVNV